MFGSVILEVAIGLALAYLLLSLICTAVAEWLAWRFSWRSQMLYDAVCGMLRGTADTSDDSLARRFFDHDLVHALTGPGRKAPSYLPSHTFAKVLLDLLLGPVAGKPDATIHEIRQSIEERASERIAAALRPLTVRAAQSQQPVLAALEGQAARWFDDRMQRLSGNYKRRTQWAVLAAAAAVVLALNADTFMFARVLIRNDALRAEFVQSAAARVRTEGDRRDVASDVDEPEPQPSERDTPPDVPATFEEYAALQLPVGWTAETWPDTRGGFLLKFAGLLVTITAVSFGAPFWFDVLNKLVNLRSSGAKPATTETDSPTLAPEPIASTARPQTPAHPRGTDAGLPLFPAKEPPLDDFDAKALAFSLPNAHGLARAARLAYEPDVEILRTTLTEWGLAQVRVFDKGTTQAFLGGGGQHIIMAFRGTEPRRIEDLTTDGDCKLVPGPFGNDRAHSGFTKGLDLVWDEMLMALEQLRNSNQTVWISGHSLGGGLATLAAARLAKAGAIPVQGLYTFGCPRVGDGAFKEAFDARLVRRAFRFVNHSDIVPRVPMRSMNYKHVGTVMYFDRYGTLQQKSLFWLRALELAFSAANNLGELAKQSVSGHSMDLYLQLVENAKRRQSA
jgi:triacylglycerol lipase